jgi:hypothetical protein
MPLREYMFVVGLGTLAVLAMGMPIVVAAVVALWPGNRPAYKFRFIIACSVVVYGIGGLLEVALLPIELFGTHISPQLEHDGHTSIPYIVRRVWAVIQWLPTAGGVLAAILVPIVARRLYWSQLCALSANYRLNSDAAKPRTLG